MTDQMRVLTVRQPWAWAIVHGGKDVENRTRSLGPYRGPTAIHASLQDSAEDGDTFRTFAAWREWWEANGRPGHQRGHVIGVVDLADVHRHGDCPDSTRLAPPGLCSPWALYDHHHLVLANPRPLPRPIPATGRLGLWRPDDALATAIHAQLDPTTTTERTDPA